MAEHPVSEPEEWRPVPGWPDYEASSLGLVRSLDRWLDLQKNGRPFRHFYRGVVLRPSMGTRYLLISLNSVSMALHKVVCLTFHGPRPSKDHQVAHWNGDHADNRAANLRWATPRENKADELRHGRRVLGVRHHRSKLTESDIRAIRQLRADTGMFYKDIGQRFGISDAQAWVVANGKNWGHVP